VLQLPFRGSEGEIIMPDKAGIWTIDEKGVTTFANTKMAKILGTTPLDLTDKSSFDYIYPEDMKAAQKLFESKKEGDIDPFTFKLRRKDGTGVWVRIQGTPMFEGKMFKGVVGTFTEI
jgi:PAS domain S-box-containing protein